jgi:hypothetical protein
MTVAGGSLASFLPRMPILPYVGVKSEWDEWRKSGHNGTLRVAICLRTKEVGGQAPEPPILFPAWSSPGQLSSCKFPSPPLGI